MVSIRQTLKYNNQATNGSFSACQIIYTLNSEKKKVRGIFYPMLADNRQSISLGVPRLCPLVLLIKSSITLKRATDRWWGDTEKGKLKY